MSTMRFSWIGFVAVVTSLIAGAASANESPFSFTMEHRYINGAKNGILHDLDAGTLIISGEIWATGSALGAVGPYTVTVQVYEKGIIKREVCRFDVTPARTIGTRVAFRKTCSPIPAARLYVVAWKASDDGVDLAAMGMLTTK